MTENPEPDKPLNDTSVRGRKPGLATKLIGFVRHNPFEVCTFLLTVAGVVGTFIVVGIYSQLHEIRSQLRVNQRAWLSLEFVPNLQLADAQPFDQIIAMTNTGKTPAKKIEGRLVTHLLRPDENIEFDYRHGTLFQTGFMPPNERIQFPSRLIERDIPQQATPAEISITPAIREELGRGALFAVTYGRITYADGFGESHWVQFCGFGPGNGLVATKFQQQCTNYNEDDTQFSRE